MSAIVWYFEQSLTLPLFGIGMNTWKLIQIAYDKQKSNSFLNEVNQKYKRKGLEQAVFHRESSCLVDLQIQSVLQEME